MAKDTLNFKANEFACHHCGRNGIAQKVIDMCQKIRAKLGVPVKVNSGYRCEKHNASVGGVKGSYHTQGLAADLSCSLGAKVMFETVQQMERDGELPELSYCIRYKNFIHVDCGKARRSKWEIRA